MNAGNLRRTSPPAGAAKSTSQAADPKLLQGEEKLLVQAVVSSKLPALTSSDARIFRELLKDVWPRVEPDEPSEPELRAAIRTALVSQKLLEEESQVCCHGPSL